MSVAEIKNENIYDFDTMLPLEGGLNDSRMGTSSFRHNCLSCNGNSFDCPGHFGHLTLIKPVYHIGTLDVVKKVLSCVCYNCSKLLISNVPIPFLIKGISRIYENWQNQE